MHGGLTWGQQGSREAADYCRRKTEVSAKSLRNSRSWNTAEGNQEGNTARPWGCWSLSSNQDAVLAGVQMCADVCVTRMKGLNEKRH